MSPASASRRPKAEILPVMVGTGGHVDHGKTALVGLLTGCLTDTLREEQERGLTIDIGFAPYFLPDGRVAGIVDVPGHEDFIRNMVAGAASIDVLMLVVAADDAVMAQTVEHVKIVRLLRTPRVFAVLTKTDLVDAEALELARDDVCGFMARAGFPDAPVVPMSNKTLEGIDEVRAVLNRMIGEVRHAEDPRAFRMNVENAFSVKGAGTVATGVPLTGEIRVGDEVEVLPSGERVAVRAIQAYGRAADAVRAHACAALNLRGIEPEKLPRGAALAAPGVYRATSTVLVAAVNASESAVLKKRSEVRFHSGTAAAVATAKVLDAEELPPGERACLELRLAAPMVLAAGDRFIIRSLSPAATVGGGAVLSAFAERPRKLPPGLAERLAAAREAVEAGDFFASELLAGPRAAVGGETLARLTQLAPEAARQAVEAKVHSGELLALGSGEWLVRARLGEIATTLKVALARYHKANKYSWGMKPAHAAGLVGLGPGSFPKLAGLLAAEGGLALKHGCLALEGFGPAISAAQLKLREAILQRVTAGGVNAPARGDLLKELGVKESEMRLILRLLAEEGLVVAVGNHLLAAEVLEDCRRKLLALFERSANMDIAAFRTATGVSRNLAVAVLEHFDSQGLTRRSGEGRVLVKAPVKEAQR